MVMWCQLSLAAEETVMTFEEERVFLHYSEARQSARTSPKTKKKRQQQMQRLR